MKKERKECKEVGCDRKGVYVEDAPNGEKILCIPAKHHGEDHVRKYSFDELKRMLT